MSHTIVTHENGWTTYAPAIDWPSREEWAEQRRTVYLGDEIPREFMERHQHLVTDAMRAAARAELDALWTALRTHMRGAQGPIVDKLLRTRAISYDEALARIDTPADAARHVRHEIRQDRARGLLCVPIGYNECVSRIPAVGQAHPLTAVRAYEAAVRQRHTAATEDWLAHVHATPIDDDAWACELERRARFANPGNKET